MREKLIELLDDIQRCGEDFDDYEIYGMRLPNSVSNDDVADHLIANGVTIQKWIPVTERLPDEEGWYQVYTTPDKGYKSINKARFCKGFEWDNFTPEWHGAGGRWRNVTHWMPLPEAPKGE